MRNAGARCHNQENLVKAKAWPTKALPPWEREREEEEHHLHFYNEAGMVCHDYTHNLDH